jgi:hypothetical protein
LSPDAYFPTRGEALNAMLANICGSGFYFPGKSYKILPLYDDLSPRLHISDYDVVGVKALPSIDNYAAQSWDTNHEYADAATWDSRDQQTYNFLLKSGASVQSTINIPFACDSRTELDGYPGANPPYGSTISSFSPNFPTPSYQFLSLANSAIYYNYNSTIAISAPNSLIRHAIGMNRGEGVFGIMATQSRIVVTVKIYNLDIIFNLENYLFTIAGFDGIFRPRTFYISFTQNYVKIDLVAIPSNLPIGTPQV